MIARFPLLESSPRDSSPSVRLSDYLFFIRHQLMKVELRLLTLTPQPHHTACISRLKYMSCCCVFSWCLQCFFQCSCGGCWMLYSVQSRNEAWFHSSFLFSWFFVYIHFLLYISIHHVSSQLSPVLFKVILMNNPWIVFNPARLRDPIQFSRKKNWKNETHREITLKKYIPVSLSSFFHSIFFFHFPNMHRIHSQHCLHETFFRGLIFPFFQGCSLTIFAS